MSVAEGVRTRAQRRRLEGEEDQASEDISAISGLRERQSSGAKALPIDTGEQRADAGSAHSSSGSSRASKASKASQDALVRLATAKAEMENLMEAQNVEREEEELLRMETEFQLRREELNRKRRHMEAKGKLKIAQAEADILCAMDDQHRGNDPRQDELPGRTAADNIEYYFRSVKEEPPERPGRRILPRTPIDARRVDAGDDRPEVSDRVDPNVLSWSSECGPGIDTASSGRLLQVIEQHERCLKQQQQIMATIANEIQLPKREILTFDGNPLDFFLFKSYFDTAVADKTEDYGTKLSHLISHCQGEARQAIKHCAVVPGKTGYDTAWEILKRRFGQPHRISEALLKKVVDGPAIKASDSAKLFRLALDMKSAELTLTRMGCESDMNSSTTLDKIVLRLPTHTQQKWVSASLKIYEKGKFPDFHDLTRFVEQQADASSSRFGQLVGKRPDDTRSRPEKKPTNVGPRVTTLATSQSSAQRTSDTVPRQCPLCDANHHLSTCTDFGKLSPARRKAVVRERRLCDLCFSSSHFSRACPAPMTCGLVTDSGLCPRRHHHLLHDAFVNAANTTPTGGASRSNATSVSQTNGTTAITTGRCGATGGTHGVMLGVLPVKIMANGAEVEVYAFIDNGSDTTLVDRRLVEALGISGRKVNEFTLTTMHGSKSQGPSEKVSLRVSSFKGDQTITIKDAWTVDGLPISPGSAPSQEDLRRWPHLRNIKIPQLKDTKVSLLIGCDVPEAHWVLEQKRGRSTEPYAVRTRLGWTLRGPAGRCNNEDRHVNFVTRQHNDLHEALERMYNHDFPEAEGDHRKAHSIKERKALKIMEDSTVLVDGHYQIRLPWDDGNPDLPNNRPMAERRLALQKARFKRDPDLFDQYKSVVKGYIENGHAEKVPHLENIERQGPAPSQLMSGRLDVSSSPRTNPPGNSTWYIPHHHVIHPAKKKVRVVFDCAAKFKGVSLNEQLIQGPDQTNSLVGVLIRFRQEPVAVVADIEQMFHQVKVAPVDRDAIRFLWWRDHDLDKDIQDYRMTVHLFGAKSSPACSGYALRRTAEDNKHHFADDVVETVRKNFYVDDCLKSVPCCSTAKKMVSELRQLLSRGGFKLTKWISNKREVLSCIPENDRAPNFRELQLDLDELPTDRALGVYWDVNCDAFQFKINLDKRPSLPLTRRKMLSFVASFYDPLGLVTPLMLQAKILIQELCTQGCKWDEEVTEEHLHRWSDWVNNLDDLKELSIARCYKDPAEGPPREVQLHHFADASDKGYGVASYLRFIDANGSVHCALVMGKSRVRPKKPLTVPRAELVAAVVAVKTHLQILEELEYKIDRAFFWTDSMVVRQYLSNETTKYQVFVANRVQLIRDHTDVSQWHHVPTRDNPADHASRGFSAKETRKVQHWFSGPKFLWKDNSEWPTPPDAKREIPEQDFKKSAQAHTFAVTTNDPLDRLLERYGRWKDLRRTVAYFLRYRQYLRFRAHQAKEPEWGSLRAHELQTATNQIIKLVQQRAFPDEYRALLIKNPASLFTDSSLPLVRRLEPRDVRELKRNTNGKGNSRLRKLNPVMIEGVIRVGGRLGAAPIDFNAKHPAILPNKHHVTDLIIRHYHEGTTHRPGGHMGMNYLLAQIRGEYWILQAQTAIRRVITRCMQCRRWNQRPCQQLMASLPGPRVTPLNPPFTFTGVDYFGPFMVKCHNQRSRAKRYGCLFSCLTTRAVHIEVAPSLDSDSFIGAFIRFVSRRGPPMKLYSDNGTNFRGAEAEIKDMLAHFNHKKISDCLLVHGTDWYFNPPAASHHGGAWERMIRSVRKILRSLIEEQLVGDFTLLTLMAEVEKILNDRPLVRLPDDPESLEVLTPSTILLLRPNPCSPPGEFNRGDLYSRRWRQAHYLADLFWKRWIREYLPTLQERGKWQRPHRNLAVGDLVLICDDNSPRGQWPKGIVDEVYPDRRGIVRKAKVRTAKSSFLRDVRKLCVLEGVDSEAAET